MDETATVYGLVIGADGHAHLPGDDTEALCGQPAERFMHPAETATTCRWCAAVIFRWN